MPRLTVLLPCYNEEAALPALLSRLAGAADDLAAGTELAVLVVDDGSADATAEIAARGVPGLQVELARHPVNMGLGAALATGIAWFLEHGGGAPRADEWLAVMDADGTHPPEYLPGMLALANGEAGASASGQAVSAQYDIVIARRYAPGGSEHGLSLLRSIYSRLTSVGFQLLAHVRGARDYSCGYRLYRGELLARAMAHYRGALVTERGFTCMVELLVKLWRRGARVGEYPLELHYELKAGASKMNVPATIRRYAVLAWRVLFDRRFR